MRHGWQTRQLSLVIELRQRHKERPALAAIREAVEIREPAVLPSCDHAAEVRAFTVLHSHRLAMLRFEEPIHRLLALRAPGLERGIQHPIELVRRRARLDDWLADTLNGAQELRQSCAAIHAIVRGANSALARARQLADCPIGLVRLLSDRERWAELTRTWREMGQPMAKAELQRTLEGVDEAYARRSITTLEPITQ